MKLPLSQRLLACCRYVHPGDRVADIGCDHGYLGIHLLKAEIADTVIAADVNESPLSSALRNAEKFGVREKMSFFLSNGVQNVPRDFTCMVCAGMGADTMISILDAAPWLRDPQYRIILQCQSKRPELRRYLASHGFSISRETLAKDGKFLYPIMEVCFRPAPEPMPWDYYISPQLLEDRSPLLPEFRNRVLRALEDSAIGLARIGGEQYDELMLVIEHLRQTERNDEHGNCC